MSSSTTSSKDCRGPGQSSSNLPVFVFPANLTFYADDSSSYKQVLTLYNPYDFSVRFKVLSTSPHKYNVQDPEGCIKPRCYVDIVVRINDVSQRLFNRSDEFRICMYQMAATSWTSSASSAVDLFRKSSNPSSVSGYRDVVATLYATKPSVGSTNLSSDGGKSFESIPGDPSTQAGLTQSQIFASDIDSPSSIGQDIRGLGGRGPTNRPSQYYSHPNYFLILISVAAAVVLMMPNSDEEKPTLLSFLPLPGIHVKLCAAYVLGCVTKPLFWP